MTESNWIIGIDMKGISVNGEEFVKRCEQVYVKNRVELEKKYDGKIVALFEKGVAGMGDNVDSAYGEAKRNHPDKIFYFRRVGKFSAAGILF